MQMQIDLIDHHYPAVVYEFFASGAGTTHVIKQVADPTEIGTKSVRQSRKRDLKTFAFKQVFPSMARAAERIESLAEQSIYEVSNLNETSLISFLQARKPSREGNK
jgi:hypothetical protein